MSLMRPSAARSGIIGAMGHDTPLNLAPFSTTFPANLYKFDPFHVLKFGIFAMLLPARSSDWH